MRASCLTHFDSRIQQDGLTLLDTFIEKAPSFVENNYASILPNCLDQISNKKGGGSDSKNKVRMIEPIVLYIVSIHLSGQGKA